MLQLIASIRDQFRKISQGKEDVDKVNRDLESFISILRSLTLENYSLHREDTLEQSDIIGIT